MLYKFSAWTHLSNFDQSEHKNWKQSVTNAWPWWAKSKATVFLACNSWLNFRVRGPFEIKNLTAWLINTTYFIWIFLKSNLKPAIIWKLVTCQRITSKNTWFRCRWCAHYDRKESWAVFKIWSFVSRWRGVNMSTAEWIFVNYAAEIYDLALNLFQKLLKNKVCRIFREKDSLIPLISVFWCTLLVITINPVATDREKQWEKSAQKRFVDASIMKSTEGKTRGSPKILNSPWNQCN